MSWRNGLEMRSAINTTALSLHYLHLYMFWRCFGGYDYLSGSAREANSAWLLCRYLHRRHHLQLFQQFRQKITSTRTLLKFLWYMRPCMSLSSPQFNHIHYFWTQFLLLFRKVHLFGKQITHIVSSFHTFHICFAPAFTSSSLWCTCSTFCMRILAPFSLLTCFDSRVYHLFNASKLYVTCPPTKASGSIVISATKSSPSHEKCHNSTYWCCWIIGHHFYRVYNLNTITIYPTYSISFHTSTPINTLSSHQILET